MTALDCSNAVLLAGGAILAQIILPGTLELLTLTVASIWPRRPYNNDPVTESVIARPLRLAVIIPAHDEEENIENCIRSVRSAKAENLILEVFVVADNCRDDTAALAWHSGARVIVRNNNRQRGKGFALQFAFERLLEEEDFDAFAVIDADTKVDSHFFARIAPSLIDGADGAQGRYLVRPSQTDEDSIRSRCLHLALLGFNVVRPQGRERLGLSAGLFGNGFVLSAATLRAVPYEAGSVVEDLEYHLKLVRSGRRIRFVDSAKVFAQAPPHADAASTQRSRWEGGRFRMIREQSLVLLLELLRGRWRMAELLLDLLLLPLAFHVALPSRRVHSVVCCPDYRRVRLFTIALHLLVTLVHSPRRKQDAIAPLSAPLYMFWKWQFLPSLLQHAGASATWNRTARKPGKQTL